MSLSAEFSPFLRARRLAWNKALITIAILAVVIAGCCYYAGLFDMERLSEGIPSLVSLISEMFPPDFEQWKSWIKPLVDTLAMSVAGTAFAIVVSVPLAVLPVRTRWCFMCSEVC